MVSVAIIGPDGAGKTTICRSIEHTLPIPVKYLYMGVSLASGNVMLPTTRLARYIKRLLGAPPDTTGPRDPDQVKPKHRGKVKQLFSGLRSSARLINWLIEEGYRQFVAWSYQLRGCIVLYDRHFYFDFYAYDIAKQSPDRTLTRRIHGFFLEHIYPKPDLVIYLDAPGDVLYARKGEGSVEILERRRKDYLSLQKVFQPFVTVDATQSEEAVLSQVTQIILDSAGVKVNSRVPFMHRTRKFHE